MRRGALSVQLKSAATKSHSFSPMNRDQRRLVHEYADYFHMDHEAFDHEPVRNIVVTATWSLLPLPPSVRLRHRPLLLSHSLLVRPSRFSTKSKAPSPLLSAVVAAAASNGRTVAGRVAAPTSVWGEVPKAPRYYYRCWRVCSSASCGIYTNILIFFVACRLWRTALGAAKPRRKWPLAEVRWSFVNAEVRHCNSARPRPPAKNRRRDETR